MKTTRSHAIRKFAAIVLLGAVVLSGTASAQCKLEKFGEWPVRLTGDQLVTDGSINGQKVGILLDTGSTRSLVTREAAERLELPRQRVRGRRAYGVGGEVAVESAEIAEFRLGDGVRTDWKVDMAEVRTSTFSFILGDDFFEKVELEIDLPHRMIRLFHSRDCESAPLAYWNPQSAAMVPLEQGRRIHFTAQLDGISLRTMLDSGAGFSMVALPAARRAGFDPEAPGTVTADCTVGLGSRALDGWHARFERLEIGAQTISDPTLRVSDLWRHVRRATTGSRLNREPGAFPDMLLGMDFLKTHRVFVSRQQRKMYFTHEGGVVFPSSPGISCEGVSTERQASARIAEYDARISANGTDSQALFARSHELNLSGDKVGALRDLDALLALDPANTPARVQRARILMQRKEYERAIGDFDAAISGGMRTARTYAMRGLALHRKGDRDRAMEDFEVALKLDPRDIVALYWRGVQRLEAGNRAGAQTDLDVLEKVDPRRAAELRKRIADGGP